MTDSTPDPTMTAPNPLFESEQDPPIFSDVQNGTHDSEIVPETGCAGHLVHEDEYRELTRLNSYVVKSVMDMLAGNPMIGPMLGPDFRKEAETIGERVTVLLGVINPDNNPV